MIATFIGLASQNAFAQPAALSPQWLHHFNTPRCYTEDMAASGPGVNALVLGDAGMADVPRRVFMPWHLAASWGAVGGANLFDDNGAYGPDYQAYEFYPTADVKLSSFFLQRLFIPSVPALSDYPIGTVILFAPSGTLDQTQFYVRFFEAHLPPLPTSTEGEALASGQPGARSAGTGISPIPPSAYSCAKLAALFPAFGRAP